MTVWDEDHVQFRGRLYGYDKVRILSGDRWGWVPTDRKRNPNNVCDFVGLVHKVNYRIMPKADRVSGIPGCQSHCSRPQAIQFTQRQ